VAAQAGRQQSRPELQAEGAQFLPSDYLFCPSMLLAELWAHAIWPGLAGSVNAAHAPKPAL
jgi:hypothetical protein